MALLADETRKVINNSFQRELSNDFTPMSLTSAQLQAIVNAIDDYIDASSTAFFSQSIPVLTDKQKVRILQLVINERYKVL